ncbi:prolyl-tRNA synthetase associated domain-containing protein [Pseudomonas putida]|uniref:prolyl-tRNA synthetase associated domain-containing protein n=1 Tax=Pseudomonas putida TaxID=303 RepID=UPI00300EE621
MLDSEQLLARLEASEINYAIEQHARIYNMAESDQLVLSLPGMRCKNLLLRDRKGRHYLAVTTPQKSVELAALSTMLGCGRLSLAPPERLFELLGVTPGSLSPLALINDQCQGVRLVVDRECEGAGVFLFHPMDNGASVQISLEMLQRFLDGTGHSLEWTEIHARS